jgi:hypothetical protein
MIELDNLLHEKERKLLRSCIGKQLRQFQGVMLGDAAWHTVRLETAGPAIDITCTKTLQQVDDAGNTDEFGTMKVSIAKPETLHVPDIEGDAETRTLDGTITGVHIANERISVTVRGKTVSTRQSTQAIILELDDSSSLVVDRGVWFSEMLVVSRGNYVGSMLYDGSQDWEDDPDEDPDTHYDYASWIERA